MTNQGPEQPAIEDTSRRDPLIHLAGGIGGFGRYIEEMESAGQPQLVNSTMLPTKMNSGTDDDLRELGFELGDPDPSDPMFRPAMLPKGWTKAGTEHPLWSKVLDELGRTRLLVFYKAAFYDRDAFINVQTLAGYARDVVNGAPLVFDDEWATSAAMREAIQAERDYNAEQQETYASDYTAGQIAKADAVLAKMSGGE